MPIALTTPLFELSIPDLILSHLESKFWDTDKKFRSLNDDADLDSHMPLRLPQMRRSPRSRLSLSDGCRRTVTH